MLRISGMTVALLTFRNRMEIPDNAAHFRDDGGIAYISESHGGPGQCCAFPG